MKKLALILTSLPMKLVGQPGIEPGLKSYEDSILTIELLALSNQGTITLTHIVVSG